ncbi:MAG: SPASM domain-containing protein [Bacilli bacterium]|nr:SPASM domain-containing protein [Bacilli bacterium]
MKKFKKIYVEITNTCNLNCSFCSKVEKPKRIITKEEFSHILSEIKPFTDNIYLHVKGEPLLHPNLIDFLNIAEKNDIKVNITTNGILFPKKVDELIKCNSLQKINFSLHSENNVPNYLENIFKSVEKLKNQTVIYRLWTLQDGKFDKKSTKTVEKIIEYYKLSPETVEKIYKENNVKITSTIYVDKDNEFEWPDDNKNETTNGFCMALKTQIAILVDGTVVPCCLDSNGKINLGNIYTESFESIINSKRCQDLKKSFQDRKPCEKLCLSCTYKNRFK